MSELILRSHPFSLESGVIAVRAGTIADMLREAAGGEYRDALRVEVAGHEVPRQWWGKLRPKEGTAVHVTAMPQGGGNGKKILRTVLLVAVSVAAIAVSQGALAPYVAGFWATSTGAIVMGAAISVLGTLAINAMLPPPSPKLSGGQEDAGRWNMLTGTSNQINPYGPIPFVVGECKIFPPHAAMPYSETVGGASYQRCMFDLGHGEIEVEDIRIGETPIAEFDEVEWEITKNPTLYTSDVNEVVVSAAMNDGMSVTRLTSPGVEEISLDVIFPGGLFGVDKKGKTVQASAALTVEYRAVGASAWTPVPVGGQGMTGDSGQVPRTRVKGFSGVMQAVVNSVVRTPDRKPFAVAVAWSVPVGQYEVRVSRGATNWGGAGEDARMGDAQWTVLRSIKHTNPSTTGTNKLCVRIKSTNQLNGALQTLSCIVRQLIPVYSPVMGTWVRTATLNPGWVYHWLLTECQGMSTHVPPERIDLDGIMDYANFCDVHQFQIRGTVDARATARALLDDVLRNGLGTVTLRDGRYGVLFDDGGTLPTMTFTPRDIRGLSVSRPFARLPHAFRVRFRNPAHYWEHDEIIVLDDGYSYRGADARGNPSSAPEATEFETLELRFSASPVQAWKIARYHFAQAKFRPEVYQWETDIANLSCTRGDVVHVSHDVTEWGYGAGVVMDVDGDTVALDETLELEAGKSYSAHVRNNVGQSTVYPITAASLETNTFTGVTAQPGDIVVIGETNRVTQRVIVTGITPSDDLGAGMRAVIWDDRLLPYWAIGAPTITSEITGIVYRAPPDPPNITVILSDQRNDAPNDGGITEPEVHIGVQPPSGFIAPPRGGGGGRDLNEAYMALH